MKKSFSAMSLHIDNGLENQYNKYIELYGVLL